LIDLCLTPTLAIFQLYRDAGFVEIEARSKLIYNDVIIKHLDGTHLYLQLTRLRSKFMHMMQLY